MAPERVTVRRIDPGTDDNRQASESTSRQHTTRTSQAGNRLKAVAFITALALGAAALGTLLLAIGGAVIILAFSIVGFVLAVPVAYILVPLLGLFFPVIGDASFFAVWIAITALAVLCVGWRDLQAGSSSKIKKIFKSFGECIAWIFTPLRQAK